MTIHLAIRPWMAIGVAALAMALSSLSVVTNSLRLRRFVPTFAT